MTSAELSAIDRDRNGEPSRTGEQSRTGEPDALGKPPAAVGTETPPPSQPVAVWTHRPNPEPTSFPRSGWGHRGYDEISVDAYVERATKDREAAQAQITDLRAEIDRLHRYIRRQWAAVAIAESRNTNDQPVEGAGLASPAAQAQAVLSQAQEIAERRLAQADDRLSDAQRQAADRLAAAQHEAELTLANAERQASRLIGAGQDEAAARLTRVDVIAEQVLQEARQAAANRQAKAADDADRLLLLARTRYEDIVVRAHQRADHAAEVALAEFQSSPGPERDGGRTLAVLEMKAAYLRTFAKVSRGSLHAALDITAREFDRLLGASAAGAEFGPAPLSPGLTLEPRAAAPRANRAAQLARSAQQARAAEPTPSQSKPAAFSDR